mgnify:CR=1 FL=1
MVSSRWDTPPSLARRQQKLRDNVRLALKDRKHYDVRTGEWNPGSARWNPGSARTELRSPVGTKRKRNYDRPSSAGRRRRISLAREIFNEHASRKHGHVQADRLWRSGRYTSSGDHIVDNNRDGIYFNGKFVPYSNSLKRKTSISRHKKARKARTMARSRYASKAKRSSRRGYKSKGMKKSFRRPKGAYRGATIPKWMKGETKHILVHDGCTLSTAARDTTAKQTESGTYSLPACVHGSSKKLNIGALQSYVLNPCPQGNDRAERNGRSIDGTYLRVQGHLHNKATRSAADANIQQRAYIRMLLLSVKGGSVPFESGGTNAGDIGTGTGSSYRVGHAPFLPELLFKKIDGSIHGFTEDVSAAEASKRVRSLQLPVNKSRYTVLSDQTFQLSAATEGFGSSDILFDKKIKLKQRTTWSSTNVDSFQKNQLVAVFMTVDPHMYAPSSGAVVDSNLTDKIELEFESKYSYKDF